MTKKVRIENADTSSHVIDVQVWSVGCSSDGGPRDPDKLIRTHVLNAPTQMVEEYVHSGQYIVIKERVENERGPA